MITLNEAKEHELRNWILRSVVLAQHTSDNIPVSH